jgi:hypothetical protein
MTGDDEDNEHTIKLPSSPELADAAEEARLVIENRLANLDPQLLVELSVGLRSRSVADAGWNDSFIDRFLDSGGKFGDVFINLHGAQAQFRLGDDPRFGGSDRLHG